MMVIQILLDLVYVVVSAFITALSTRKCVCVCVRVNPAALSLSDLVGH